VPTLLGLTMEQAQKAAADAGVKLEQGPDTPSTLYAKGQICSTSAPSGTSVSPDQPVKVQVSSGPSEVTVPYVVGKSEPDAYQAISDAGFKVGNTKQQNSDKVDVNAIISQDPPGGVPRPPGTSIDLVISLGPKPPDNTPPPIVPDQPTTISEERSFPITVKVPDDAEGPQEVRVEVTDDRTNNNVVYKGTRNPGDKFDVKIKGYGTSIDVKTYIGGVLDNDTVY